MIFSMCLILQRREERERVLAQSVLLLLLLFFCGHTYPLYFCCLTFEKLSMFVGWLVYSLVSQFSTCRFYFYTFHLKCVYVNFYFGFFFLLSNCCYFRLYFAMLCYRLLATNNIYIYIAIGLSNHDEQKQLCTYFKLSFSHCTHMFSFLMNVQMVFAKCLSVVFFLHRFLLLLLFDFCCFLLLISMVPRPFDDATMHTQ